MTGTEPAAQNVRSLPVRRVRYAILGAGFGGLGTAIRLDRDLGEHDWLILDRHREVGGTWWANTYPGAQCDIPSNLYSFSFAPNPDWHTSFACQPEIRDYLIALSHRYRLRDRIAFETTMTGARWDADRQHWEIETTRGTVLARYLIAAPGPLSEPRIPALDGIDEFAGEIMHTGAWRPDVVVDGRRVAVVGSGASAIQVVPRLAGRASRLTVFQRTPPWIMPHGARAIAARERGLRRRMPALQRVMRASQYLAREAMIPGFVYEPALQRVLEWLADHHRERQVADPALRARLRPTYRLGCKRILPSNDWYPALQRPDVTLVEHGVRRLTASGLVAADGSEHAADVVVFATGFQVTDVPLSHLLVGGDGRTLAEIWDGSPSAYRGMTIAGFPNLFLLVGPNTGLGTNSIVFMIEAQLNYVIDALRRVAADERVLEVRADAQEAYAETIQRRVARTVWTRGGCGSWYIDARGRVTTLWPDFTFRYWAQTRHFDPASYVVSAPV